MLVSIFVGLLFVVGGIICRSITYSLFGIGVLCAYLLVADLAAIFRLPARKD